MKLKRGLYEQIINQFFQFNLNKESKSIKIEKEKIEKNDSIKNLSTYISDVTYKALEQLKNKNTINQQIELVNKMIKSIVESTDDENFKDYLISEEAEMLLTVLDNISQNDENSNFKQILRSITPLSQNSLLTGAEEDPELLNELKKEITSANRVDMLVSFVRWSGLRLILDELKNFTQRKGKIRLITTCYMGASDYKAIEELARLPNSEIKISFDTARTRLHAKAYLFYRNTGFSTAYIGSANLSRTAITSGLEWNVKISEYSEKELFKKIDGTFESYWNDHEFELFDLEKNGEKLKFALYKEKYGSEFAKQSVPTSFHFDIQLYPYQQEILDNLESERIIHNKYRNLVVAATGTGKTIISAFDYKRYCQNNPKQINRLLFIAHREEILKQSRDCFRQVLRDENFGELWVGDYQPIDGNIDHLFVSVQTFNAKDIEKITATDFYDFIIIDEFHHAAAKTYRTILNYYHPKILLGLTATPERMDGKDVLKYFDDRIASELRLKEAINRKLLSPFHYFGVSDSVKLSDLKWSRGGYDKSELEELYINNLKRVELIINALEKYTSNIKDIIGIGFCVGVKHAKFMAEMFNKYGISSIDLNASSSKDVRRKAINKLVSKEIHFIFVVDLYNEGVDIPQVNTVLFLRPTESLTVFIQQLGRGLRISKGKECLTVLDFVGRQNERYNFDRKFRALLGRTRHGIKKEIENQFPHVPKGCFIKLEKQAQQYILENIQSSINNVRNLTMKIRNFENQTGLQLNLQNFIEYHDLELYNIYSRTTNNKRGWNRLCVTAGIKTDFNEPDEKELSNGLYRLININSRRWIQFLLDTFKNVENFNESSLNEEELQWLLMFYYTFWQIPPKDNGLNSYKDMLKKLQNNPILFKEIIEILEYNYEHINFLDKRVDLDFPCGLDLHCKYTLDQILAGIGKYSFNSKPRHSEGTLYLKERNLDVFFVTLNKSEKEYSPSTMYNDYSISETLFHWQSQSTTPEDSPVGQRYIKQDHPILLFVRKYKKENGQTAAYHYLGKIMYHNHNGSKPINFIWKLNDPIPSFLQRDTKKFTIG
ncbi:MAG: DUF3427 domain-containing protein [Promethearchaeota archaeon]